MWPVPKVFGLFGVNGVHDVACEMCEWGCTVPVYLAFRKKETDFFLLESSRTKTKRTLIGLGS